MLIYLVNCCFFKYPGSWKIWSFVWIGKFLYFGNIIFYCPLILGRSNLTCHFFRFSLLWRASHIFFSLCSYYYLRHRVRPVWKGRWIFWSLPKDCTIGVIFCLNEILHHSKRNQAKKASMKFLFGHNLDNC